MPLDLLRLRRSRQACTSLDGRTLVTFRFVPEFPSDTLLGVLQRIVRPSTLGLSRPSSRATRPRISRTMAHCRTPCGESAASSTLWQGVRDFQDVASLSMEPDDREVRVVVPLFGKFFVRSNHLRQFQHMRRLTQRHGRMLKKTRLEGYLQQAEPLNPISTLSMASSAGLLPRLPTAGSKFGGDHDEIIDSCQECEIIRRRYTGVWGVQAPVHCRLLSPCSSHTSPDLPPFTYEGIKFHVHKIRVHKAVPNGVPHPGLWRLASPTLSSQLLSHCQAHWNSPSTLFLPAWRQTWVVLIPKPGKPSGRIKSMRPIALQDPLGKAFVSLLALRFRRHALRFLKDIHQYAYIPHRDVLGCLVRAMDHCRHARRLLRAQTYNLRSLRQGGPKRPYVAALQVSIDLSQAFDSAPWDLLREALRRTSTLSCAWGALLCAHNYRNLQMILIFAGSCTALRN